jgi:hypothetical protein
MYISERPGSDKKNVELNQPETTINLATVHSEQEKWPESQE